MPQTHNKLLKNIFERLETDSLVVTDSVNKAEFDEMFNILNEDKYNQSELILLKAPRAGFGKTHLLERLRKKLADSHEFIAIDPCGQKRIDCELVLSAIMHKFTRPLPNKGGLTTLDLIARRVFAESLIPLVENGSVPSDDKEGALKALSDNPSETFDFHNDAEVTAQWAKKSFSRLRPLFAQELSELCEVDVHYASWWLLCLFNYSSGKVEGREHDRNAAFFDVVIASDHSEMETHPRLVAFLKIFSIIAHPVIVLDELEAYYADTEGAMLLVSFLKSLNESCGKLNVIVSLNSDVWDTAFLPRLSGGLKDRMMERIITLKPLTKDVVGDLIQERVGQEAYVILSELDLDIGVLYARRMVKESAKILNNRVMTNEEIFGKTEYNDSPVNQFNENKSHQEPVSLIMPSNTAIEVPRFHPLSNTLAKEALTVVESSPLEGAFLEESPFISPDSKAHPIAEGSEEDLTDTQKAKLKLSRRGKEEFAQTLEIVMAQQRSKKKKRVGSGFNPANW